LDFGGDRKHPPFTEVFFWVVHKRKERIQSQKQKVEEWSARGGQAKRTGEGKKNGSCSTRTVKKLAKVTGGLVVDQLDLVGEKKQRDGLIKGQHFPGGRKDKGGGLPPQGLNEKEERVI